MSHTVSGLLRKPPFIKDNCGQDGQSKMYAIELSEMTKDYQTQEKSYTNYKALFFAKTDAARGYYDKAFAEGSFIVVTCEKLKVEQREHNGTNYISLQMENARLEAAKFDDLQSSQGQQSAQQRPAQNQAPAQRPPVQKAGNAAYQSPQQGYAPAPQQQGMQIPDDDGWDDSQIPF